MAPIEVTCSNPDCGEKFQVGSEMAGELVECPTCGASVYVLEPDGAEEQGELELAGAPEAKKEKAHIAHPARMQCPNCGAVLGVRDAFCPECGADIRTGAAVTATVERKKVNLVPFFIGGGILLALVALVALIIFAVNLISEKRQKAKAALEAALAAAAAPVAKAPGAAPAAPPKPAYEIPAQVLADLADRELQAVQSVDAYLGRLRQTLSEVNGAGADQRAAGWADLYRYCADNGLQAEAEQAWYQAARLVPRDPAVNQKLGLTGDYAGMAVSPAQKTFLEGLKPRLRIVNRDPALRDHVASIEGLEPVAIPLGKSVEVEPPAGPLVLAIARADRPDRSVEEFALSAEPGVVQTVEIYTPYAAPALPADAMSAVYGAVVENQENPAVTIERDGEGRVTSAKIGDVRLVGGAGSPLEMWVTRRRDQLGVIGSIPLGNRFEAAGARLLSGSRLHPLSLALSADQTAPLRMTSGGYCVVHAELADGLWGMLGSVDGDLAYEFMRSSLERRLRDVAFENADQEARGEICGPWQTRVRLYDEAEARHSALQHDMAAQKSAAALPLYRDRARLLAASAGEAALYLNWPRFRGAIAVAMKGATPALVERLDLIGQGYASRAARPARPAGPMPGAPTTGAGMLVVQGGPMAGAAAQAQVQPAEAPDRDTALLQPPPVPLDDEARSYAMMRLLPLLPDEAVLQKVQDAWPDLNDQQKIAALMAVEFVGTPSAVAYLGQVAQNSTDTDVTAMALLSLGAIGTPEALAQTELPGVSAKVSTASLVASVVAGVPDAIDQVPAFLAGASPDEKAAFLQYVSQFDTPGALLGLSHAVDAYSDPQNGARIAAALARMGGRTAMRELSRLMEKTKQAYADQLADVRGEDALLLLRQVGATVAEEKSSKPDALRLLVADGSPASVSYLQAAAINQGNADALAALCKMGTGPALDAAGQVARAVTLQTLEELRKQWYSRNAETGQWAWNAGVDTGSARKFLEKIFTDGADNKVRIAAATMLSETDRPLPPDQLLAFARSAGGPASGSGGQGAPSGFEWPAGQPLVPKDFELTGSPSMYAIGLALQAKDPSLAAALQGFLGSSDAASLKAAAMAALGRLGGEDNLTFLRSAATKSQETYADPTELGKALEDRLAALAGLAAAQDAAFLPRALDMLREPPPPASALAKANNYDELADWWQITLWRGAADCVAGVCSQRSPLELTADSGLETMLTDRCKELIDQPGPKRESLNAARQELRASAIRAFGRVADFSDPANSFVLSRLVIDLAQKQSPAPGAAAPRAAGPRGRGPMGPPPTISGLTMPAARGPAPAAASGQSDPLRVAALDAVAHAGSRAPSVADFVGYARDLATSASLKDAWNQSLRQMAQEPTAGYFALLTAAADTLQAQAGQTIFDATRNSPDARGEQYGTFLASLIAIPAPTTAAERAIAARPSAPAPASTQTPPKTAAEAQAAVMISPEQIKAIEEASRARGQAAAAAAAAAAAGQQGRPEFGAGMMARMQPTRSTPAAGVVPGYDRRLPYKRTDWSYTPDEAGKQVAELRLKWTIIQRLIEASGPALAGVVRAGNLLDNSEVGPAAAAPMVKQDPSSQDSVIAELADLLAPSAAEQAPSAGPGFGAPSAQPGASVDARRTAICALRQIEGQPAADALYLGLVGPATEQQPASPGMMGMPGIPTPQVPAYAMQAMRASRAANLDPIAVYIARALGSMGRADLLQNALNATGRSFFQRDATGVQSAALAGMAYLPAASDPVDMLAKLVQAANVEQLRQAAAEALVTAANLIGQGQ